MLGILQKIIRDGGPLYNGLEWKNLCMEMGIKISHLYSSIYHLLYTLFFITELLISLLISGLLYILVKDTLIDARGGF